jgi:hypothetical protein
MSDADRPLAPLATREAAIETRPTTDPGITNDREAELSAERRVDDAEIERQREEAVIEAEPARQSARQRLRAFEDGKLGVDAVRINGEVERGSGSHYQNPAKMNDADRRRHAALEALVKAEDELATKSAELAAAETAHEVALANLARHEEAANGNR